MYATKRRRRNVKNYKHPPKESQKSNPSKRHRERLNAELENLASLLPFEQNILTKLDKLSILRLAVSFLRIKSYFQAYSKSSSILQQSLQQAENERSRLAQIQYQDASFSEGNAIFESLNGFILIVNENSEVFYSSRTVEQFIGFHQSDIIHQSVFELIHSEDRQEFKKHLQWNSMLPPDKAHLTLEEVLSNKEYSKYLERNFTVRFRCLLDNTSGFLTLDIVGRLSVLHGQHGAFQVDPSSDKVNSSSSKNYTKGKSTKLAGNASANGESLSFTQGLNEKCEPVLALFGIACPFGPSSLFELPHRDSLFKTKHKVSLAPISLDSKGKTFLGYTDAEYSQFGGYDLIHPDDLKYYANAHKELLKTGSSGLMCYRVQTAKEDWQWIQSSMRIIYKSNKPECILANHRSLTNEEGEELFYKRGSEFKLPYPYLYDFENNSFTSISAPPNNAPNQPPNTLANLLTKQPPTDQTNPASTPLTTSIKTSQTKSQTSKSTKANSSQKTTKPTKQTKSQMIQQRAQQHAHQQLQQQQQHQRQQHSSNYNLNEDTQLQQASTNYQYPDYYQINCKTELMENDHGSVYDPSKLMTTTPDYSTLSSSSTSSCSSVSSNLILGSNSESISVNTGQCYPYGNYFNGMNQQYTDAYNESSKFYPGDANAYNNNGLFYSNYYNYNNHYNNFAGTSLSSMATNQVDNGPGNLVSHSTNLNSHSNNSSCSSTSSSSSGSVNANSSGYSGGDGTWSVEQMDTQSLSKAHHGFHEQHGCGGMPGSPSSYAGFVEGFQYGGQQHGYNDLLVNNAAAIAAASYSCASAAAASTYGPYSGFNGDDYKPVIPQIPL